MTAELPFTRADINLGNWRERPYSMSTFQNVAEYVPSAQIISARIAETPVRPFGHFADIPVSNVAGNTLRLEDFLEESHSDALVVMRRGEVIAEWYAPYVDPARAHIVFSISKSFTGMLAGVLEAEGKLSFDQMVTDFIPDAVGSAYEGLTVRDLFNMTVALDFDELYLDEDGSFDRYRRAMLWKPQRAGDPTTNLRDFLCSLPRATHPHGTLHRYRSPNSDMAGLVVEAASGMRFADLLSTRVWQPMGAHTDGFITVDSAGNPRTSGGISVTARDLARLGELLRVGGRGVLPAEFVERLWTGGDRAIWAAGDQCFLYPGGSYLAYWYETGTGALAAMGIFGQFLWIDRASETVVVRQASEPLPISDDLDQKTIAALKAICAA